MCYGGLFLTNPGIKIRRLTPGTEIIILAGEGIPAVKEDTVDIIWIVAGLWALTAQGIRLNYLANSDLILTDRHFDKYPVSEEAQLIQIEFYVDSSAMSAFREAEKVVKPDPTQKFKGLSLPNPPPEPE